MLNIINNIYLRKIKKMLILFLIINCLNNVLSKEIIASEFVSRGFDARKGITTSPIFKLTYDGKYKWTSPHTNTVFDIPDQFSISSAFLSHETLNEGIHNSYDELRRSYAKSFQFDAGIAIDPFKAGFKYNKTLNYVHERMSVHNNSIISGNHIFSFFQINMYPSYLLDLNPMFQNALDGLPNKIENEEDQFVVNRFIGSFGTHWMNQARFGAKIDFKVAMDKNYLHDHTIQETTKEYGLYFHLIMFNISAGGYSNHSDIKVEKDFLEAVQSAVIFYGGDPTVANLNHTEAWLESIDILSHPLNATFFGLWNLVKNPEKREMLKNYIIKYINADISLKSKIMSKDLSCLGKGFNQITMKQCLLPIYFPKEEEIFETNIAESSLTELNIVMQSHYDIKAEYYSKVKSKSFLGMATKTEEIYRYYEAKYQQNKSLSKIILTLSIEQYAAPILLDITLNPYFVKYIDMLPKFNISNWYIYEELFESFGSGVIDSITLGGRFDINMYYDTVIGEMNDVEIIKKYSKWSFLGLFGSGHGSSDNEQEVNKDFDKSLKVDYNYLGGNDRMAANQYADWAKTVESNPEIIFVSVLPITTFVKDEQKKEWITEALYEYSKKSMFELDDYIKNLF